MNKYLLLHYGFENPTPEIMAAWHKWFDSIADKMVDQGGFNGGKEISDAGIKELPWNMDSITGYNIIQAENFESAEQLAQSCPYIASIRVYELRSM
ncbi:MAG: hypothetical protein HOD43_09350 [Candidatus Marinimicrobia bacterium]|jgi:hypothetical protein|nr:hypothetical protein [Candidatus Neomarinimicrobiota bacterium]MBT3823964.1 hypothetical protein [Candidatus Neomarinimicrobiota bacterium]MBT4033766.1 hypothetical protein [Candidatus Neomarinimicrobiota bacterium]MBT4295994.1 hypothetical protein [Candidatus Neomarinimicrobiota bacterium]MBT4419822.1 hypothetical protein [Candidatus Neomarinimicrobiota bacterium]